MLDDGNSNLTSHQNENTVVTQAPRNHKAANFIVPSDMSLMEKTNLTQEQMQAIMKAYFC